MMPGMTQSKVVLTRCVVIMAAVMLTVLGWLSGWHTVHAQGGPPATFNDALADMGTRVGRALTLADFDNPTSSWEWQYTEFTNTNLDCPEAGLPSNPTKTLGYIYTFVLRGARYEYRVAQADPDTLILCNSNNSRAQRGTINASAPGVCPTVGARLAVNGQGRVLPGLANRLRESGSFAGIVIGKMPAGSTFSVLAGPVCDGNVRWWQVQFGDVTGWTAEAEGGTYYLEPV